MRQCKLCSKDFPWKAKIKGKLRNLSTRNYCLQCVPWDSGKRFGGSRNQFPGTYKNCQTCGREKAYKGSWCNTCISRCRRLETKQKAIELLGGKCNRCGWNNHPAGLEFHHTDDNKEFTISDAMNHKWETVKQEVMKCELLCSCCHRIHHCKYKLCTSGEGVKHTELQPQ